MNIFKFKPITHKTFEFKQEKSPETLPKTDYKTVSASEKENLKLVKEYFTFPENSDIKIREFKTGEKDAFLVFIENMANTELIDKTVLAPLMLLKNDDISLNKIKNTLIVHNQLTMVDDFEDVLKNINLGDCVLFVDGMESAISLDVKNWIKRSIEPPVAESVIYGPHEGFSENFKTNVAMIRKNIRNENLICETVFLGKVSQTPLSIMYMKNILNPAILKEIHYRLENIGADYVTQISELEQFIEDSIFSLVPQMLTTERPDKAATSIIEGKIVLILQGSPFALILPVTISEFLTTVEDKYIRFPFAILMKTIRLLGIISSVLLSGLYIAVVNFHQEMIPPGLLLSLEAAREAVPFRHLLNFF
ncbi:MAG: spore germination protein [Clostridia bacterium]|nr:spore germination protein [Clostridia bacterium]